MQEIAFNWTDVSLTLVILFVYGIGYAFLVHWISNRKLRGQTAYIVVVGVGVTVLAAIPTFGLLPVAVMLAYFGASGLPMVIEYVLRVNAEWRKDEEAAKAEAKKALIGDEQT